MNIKKASSYSKYGYIFSVPFVLSFLIFQLYPIFFTVVIGFTDLRGVTTTTFSFLENPFQNFIDIMNSPTFITSLQNTIKIWMMNFVPQIGLALALAAWFTNDMLRLKGVGFFKVVFYMPNIITAASIAILFSALFGHPIGPINDLLVRIGVNDSSVDFLANGLIAQVAVAFIQFWMWYGVTMIILIAGIMGISPAIFEAAAIDGASHLQTFISVTLPSLRTILLYTLVTSFVGGMQMFDIPRLFVVRSGPDNATLTTSVFIFNQAFSGSYMFNRAAAASMIMFVIISIFSGILFYLMRDKEAERTKKERKMREKAGRAGL